MHREQGGLHPLRATDDLMHIDVNSAGDWAGGALHQVVNRVVDKALDRAVNREVHRSVNRAVQKALDRAVNEVSA